MSGFITVDVLSWRSPGRPTRAGKPLAVYFGGNRNLIGYQCAMTLAALV
jgi:hypothetical protein